MESPASPPQLVGGEQATSTSPTPSVIHTPSQPSLDQQLPARSVEELRGITRHLRRDVLPRHEEVLDLHSQKTWIQLGLQPSSRSPVPSASQYYKLSWPRSTHSPALSVLSSFSISFLSSHVHLIAGAYTGSGAVAFTLSSNLALIACATFRIGASSLCILNLFSSFLFSLFLPLLHLIFGIGFLACWLPPCEIDYTKGPCQSHYKHHKTRVDQVCHRIVAVTNRCPHYFLWNILYRHVWQKGQDRASPSVFRCLCRQTGSDMAGPEFHRRDLLDCILGRPGEDMYNFSQCASVVEIYVLPPFCR